MSHPSDDRTDDQRIDSESAQSRERMEQDVGEQEERKLRARREGDRGIWFGLGMFGLVGWSIAVPTVLGIALGVWLDSRFDMQISWTLTLLILGLAVGCLNAWFWLKREGNIG